MSLDHCLGWNSRRTIASIIIVILLYNVKEIDGSESIETFDGVVGAGNYTYYKITKSGTYIVILDSVSGDADIYAGEGIEKPSYDNYSYGSVTCGKDVVTISSKAKRPVGIGIYGHVSHEKSSYRLTVVKGGSKDATTAATKNLNTSNKNNSAIHTIHRVLLTLLKILFELL